ncbi:MAG TPA: retropepsin-like aspartic protease [Candidatus Angelobacter sp.]|nr:retropepsin-like aspartic protease [Candidatus Angelobacter sp.]
MLLSQAHPRSADSIELPFEYAKDKGSILLQVRINDKPALLILDTGSSHTIVRPELLGMKPSELVAAQTAAGSGFKGDAVGREVTLQVGSWKPQKQRVAVMDLSEILSVYHEKIDGILGLDFLFQFEKVTINFKEKTVVLVR